MTLVILPTDVTLLAAGWLGGVGHGLREGFAMFWVTLWPLVLGFCLSGAVQSFASRRSVARALGDHRPGAVARASGYGMASSSCSYAAAAMARSLVAKGADVVSALVFMFASTNLVVELGVVLLVLMGWQFTVGEAVGGTVMIVLLALLGGSWFTARAVAAARRHATAGDGGDHGGGGASHDERSAGAGDRAPGPDAPWRERLRTRGRLVDAATSTVSDLTMLRKELLIGYGVAGFLAALVPVHVWQAVFLHGHGFWTTLENVLVGPLVALASFVCSVGNVPLAAALWQGGISFGGVISFVFADLITFPLLLVYRRYYGTRMALRMLAGFWAVMSVAGLVTEGLFRAAGLVPAHRSVAVAAPGPGWNATTWLDLAALALLALVYWAYRHRERLGSSDHLVRDPVCGMQVDTGTAPATTLHDGVARYFCSERCLARFREDPDRWAPPGGTGAGRAAATFML